MTSSAATHKRHAHSHHAPRCRPAKTLTGVPVSIRGIAACRREADVGSTLFARSNTISGDHVTRRQRTITTSGPTSGSASLSVERPTPLLLLRSSGVDPEIGSDVPPSRMSSAAGRTSRMSPSDIIRLADDKFDRNRAAAAAAARRRFVLMTVGRTPRPTRAKNQPLSAPSGDVNRCPELTMSSSSLPIVPNSACLPHYSINIDLTEPLNGGTRLAEKRRFA